MNELLLFIIILFWILSGVSAFTYDWLKDFDKIQVDDALVLILCGSIAGTAAAFLIFFKYSVNSNSFNFLSRTIYRK